MYYVVAGSSVSYVRTCSTYVHSSRARAKRKIEKAPTFERGCATCSRSKRRVISHQPHSLITRSSDLRIISAYRYHVVSTMGTGAASSSSGALGLALFAAVTSLSVFYKRRQEEARQGNMNVLREQFKRGSICYSDFPPVVKDVLERCKLAYLATVDREDDSSHLSLMRFTYLPEDGVIVMSTNMKTKKFSMLQKQTGVALLVNDFDQFDDRKCTGAAITLNGRCYIVEPGPEAERFRQAHLRANPRYPQFIVGEDIAILAVEVQKARICDIHDRVTKWSVGEGLTPPAS